MRIDRIWGLAVRDWRMELRGPQGVWLPIVMAALLVPSSTVPLPRADLGSEIRSIRVNGDVPPEVAALDNVRVVRRGAEMRFEQLGDTLFTRGDDPPRHVREVLNRTDGVDVELERFGLGWVFPGRSILFALVSASTLTGAISASIGGERSNQTLVTLLAAAVSRLEIVLGKLTAWGGLGAFTALGAALLAIALGTIDAGGWLVPLPWVPIATTALGLWLVRRATDVIAASTTLLRVLPVILVTSGLIAWVIGRTHPLLGALIPIGGALVASGDTWPGVLPILVSTASAVACTVFCVIGTARELEHPSAGAAPAQQVFGLGALVTALWWLPTCTSLLWAEAGNFRITQQIPIETGVLTGALSFLLFVLAVMGRSDRPIEAIGWRRPTATDVGLGLLGAPVLAGILLGVVGQVPIAPAGGFLSAMADRLATTAFLSRPWGLAALLIVAEELLFRGWLTQRLGGLTAGAVYVLVKTPFDPVGGAAMAAGLGVIGARAGIVGSMGARLGALGLLAAFA